MKKQILVYIFSLLTVVSFSQVTTSLSINKPSATLSEWMSNNTTLTYVVSNSMDVPLQFIIKAELKLTDGTVVASKDLSKAEAYTLDRFETRIFFAKDVMPLETMLFNGSYKTTLQRIGKLPAGTYRLDVQLLAPVSYTGLTPVQSRVFNLSAPQLPYLIAPLNDAILDARQSETVINFKWTPLSPVTQDLPYYHIRVFEIFPYQHPLQALRGNQPVLDEVLRGQTQYFWRPQIPFSMDTLERKFIWTIQTLNSDNMPVSTDGNGESLSEPNIFYVKPRTKDKSE